MLTITISMVEPYAPSSVPSQVPTRPAGMAEVGAITVTSNVADTPLPSVAVAVIVTGVSLTVLPVTTIAIIRRLYRSRKRVVVPTIHRKNYPIPT